MFKHFRAGALRTPGAMLAACVLCVVVAPGSGEARAANADVRVLIDVSGSMQQTDPQNLRRPALRLVSELLPAGTRAGVWLFGGSADELVAIGTVDEAWRDSARERIASIHSRGQYTHIEAALDAATAGWETETEHPERHIVLLTDGRVDVSANAAESAASRSRLLSGVLERLRSYGARVHAVALSDDVDHELLDVLTATTGGLLESAATAAELQRVFLYMLEQSAAPVTVPLEGRRFTIDDSVSELTLLVFRGDEETLQLYPPDGDAIAADTARDDVNWLHAMGYDLVTVKSPAPGEWRFDGAEDPDNRAVVVTDLTLETNPIPGALLSSEVTDLDAWLNEGGERMERLELLRLVEPRLTIASASMAPASGLMVLDEERFTFEGRLDGRALEPGDYQLSFTLEGTTFKRQVNRRLRFKGDPLTVTYTDEPGEVSSLVIDIVPDGELMRPESLSGYVTVTDADGAVRAFALPEVTGGVTRLAVAAAMSGEHVVEPHLYFTTRHGRSLRLSPTPHVAAMSYTAPPAPAPEPVAEAPAVNFSWLRTVLIVVMGNAVAGLGFLVLYLLYRQRPVALPAIGSAGEGEPA